MFYSPNFVLPPLLHAKGVVTVHDLSFLRYPETHDPGLVAFLTAAVPRAVRAAALVLADSEHTRQDTIALLGVPAEKTAVLLSAADPIFRPVDDPAVLAAMRRRRGLDRPYILSVGTIQPRKNLPRLIAAVRLLRERTGEDIALVHAGRRGWLYAEVQRAVQDHTMADSFRLIEDADDGELRLLYAGAVALAYPSLYEGFGLPCVEAMACRCPVVASDVSSVPEVVGDAGLLVEPTDVEAIADALSRCLGDSELRATLVEGGTAQAARFTWERSAAKLHRLLHAGRRAVSAWAYRQPRGPGLPSPFGRDHKLIQFLLGVSLPDQICAQASETRYFKYALVYTFNRHYRVVKLGVPYDIEEFCSRE